MPKFNLRTSRPSRILIRGANWVGDAIMTTPVIRAIRKNFPDADISILLKPWVEPVFSSNPFVDRILVYDDKGRHGKGLGTIRLAKDLRAYDFDLAVSMQNAFEAALIAFLAGIPERLGYDTDGRGVLLNRSIKLDPALKKVHLIDYYRGILRGGGLYDDGRTLDLFIDPAEREWAGKILRDNGVDTQPVIGINPGATGGTAKRWFPDRFAALCQRLAEHFGVRILIFGGPADNALGDEISKLSGNVCVNLAGKTTLAQAFALIERCSLFITNDSGLMHAAAALGINQVAVIGSTNHITTPPSNLNSRIVRVPVHCSPCMKPECPYDHHQCMKNITVDMVFETALSMVAGRAAP